MKVWMIEFSLFMKEVLANHCWMIRVVTSEAHLGMSRWETIAPILCCHEPSQETPSSLHIHSNLGCASLVYKCKCLDRFMKYSLPVSASSIAVERNTLQLISPVLSIQIIPHVGLHARTDYDNKI